MPNPALPAYTRLLVLKGDRVAIWQTPTGRFLVASPGDWAAAHGPHGFTKLKDAVRAAAEVERTARAATRTPYPDLRSVLWETQATPSYHHADRRTQLALELTLTLLASPVAPGGPR